MPAKPPTTNRTSTWFVGAIAVLAIAAIAFLVFAPNPTAGAQSRAPHATPHVHLSFGDEVGSGVHVGHGYILTAAHVAAGTKGTMTLKSSNGGVQSAAVLWANKQYDVALLRIEKPALIDAVDLDCAPNYDGQRVVLHGNPLGIEFLSSAGSIVGEAREIQPWANVVPVDMTVVPGQSGGAVVDEAGDLVGIAVGVATYNLGVTGFGFVVPAATICMLLARA
jgi:S1-C subfamily serine protease